MPAAKAPAESRALRERLREAERELERAPARQVAGGTAVKPRRRPTVEGIKVLAREVPPAPLGQLRNMADVLRQRLGSGVVVLGSREDGKVSLVATVSEDLAGRVDAGTLVKALAALVGGAGGGRADFAQAGGKDPERLAAALAAVPATVRGAAPRVADSRLSSALEPSPESRHSVVRPYGIRWNPGRERVSFALSPRFLEAGG